MIRVGCNLSGMRHITKVKPVKYDEVSSTKVALVILEMDWIGTRAN